MDENETTVETTDDYDVDVFIETAADISFNMS